MALTSDLHKKIRNILKDRTPESIPVKEPDYIHSAVLIPLFKDNGEHKILLTKRSSLVEHHKGQISFPGGTVEKHDVSFLDTALREAYEEIGLSRDDVTILGQIDDRLTLVSNFVIHPFIGIFPYPYDFKINMYEVDSIVGVPLNIFVSQGSTENIADVEYSGKTYQGPVYRYDGELIWGATAKIMNDFIQILGGYI